eukprot:s2425_g2.t1
MVRAFVAAVIEAKAAGGACVAPTTGQATWVPWATLAAQSMMASLFVVSVPMTLEVQETGLLTREERGVDLSLVGLQLRPKGPFVLRALIGPRDLSRVQTLEALGGKDGVPRREHTGRLFQVD